MINFDLAEYLKNRERVFARSCRYGWCKWLFANG